MKDLTKKGILAGKILESMSEEERERILEQASETKPSRINRVQNFKNKETKRKRKFDDEDGY